MDAMKEILLTSLRFVAKHWFFFSLLALGIYAVLGKSIRKRAAPDIVKSVKLSEAGEEFALLAEVPGDAKFAFPEIQESVAVGFIQRFRHVAIAEQKKFGIPASVTLAVAYHNSIGGSRVCARECNNYFALRCDENWDGDKTMVNEKCFKRYGTAWESFRDFSIWAVGLDEYARLRKKASDRPDLWLKAFADQGLSDVADFEKLCQKFIKKYDLERLAP